MKRLIMCMMVALLSTFIYAQRMTDKLDRGLVAVVAQNGVGNFVSWRIFAEEYYDVSYNLYYNGSIIASNLKVSNYTHTTGNASGKYQVAPVVNGVEGEKCDGVSRWSGDFTYSLTGFHEGYFDIPIKDAVDRNGIDVASYYTINDVSLGDLDGDGVSEFIVKLRCDINYDMNNNTTFDHIECYNIKGERLWWIDCGPNLLSPGSVELNAVAYDWDGDGCAEVVMRGADNMIIHTNDGRIINIGDMAVDTREDGVEYTRTGREFLLYLNGKTGEPYSIGPEGQQWMDYPLPRYESDETTDLLGSSAEGEIWGSGVSGHRPTKHYFGAPVLDGRHASIFLGRGCYTRHKFCALDVAPVTHKLTQRWRWNCYDSNSPWYGNGYHNFGIADVDCDGRDEIVFGSMVIDDNGQGLSTTGLKHGDAQHCSDFDPYRKGQEIFACNESRPSMNYRDATTGKIYYRIKGSADDGRALCGNFTDKYPGCVGASTQSGIISTVADKELSDVSDFDLNFRIYWDGDLCEEVLNSPGTENKAKIDKPGMGRIFLSTNDKMCNWTKNTPSAMGDIFGDWREEIVLRAENDTKLRIYTTNYPTTYRIPTLWHDHQYRQGMVWEMCGYNQPPHASFFLGNIENITVAPPPLTMTGREEIVNGGTIDSKYNDKQTIVCETGNTSVYVVDGASPHVAVFNIPSWVQGTNSYKTDGTGEIIRDYYTCNVTGGAFTGNTRLVKQGDGILTLPAVTELYSGNTDIWAGTLNFDGSLRYSPLWLNRFAELNSDGGIFRSISMDYGSILRPGGEDNIGSIIVDSLRLGFGARVIIDIQAQEQSADFVNCRYVSVERKTGQIWESYGPKELRPVIGISTKDTDGLIAAGRYPIMKVDTLSGKLEDIKIEGINTRQNGFLKNENDTIYLVVENLRDADNIVWNGLAGPCWNLSTDKNFTLVSDPNSTDNVFVTGDRVWFNDNATQLDVNLTSDMEADTVFVKSDKDYTFSGIGSLTGDMVLVKEGSGILTIKNDNSYKGGNIIRGGTVKVSGLSNEYKESGNLGAVTNSADLFTIENGATIWTTATVTQGSAIRTKGKDGGCLRNDASFMMENSFRGSLLTKKGDGTLTLNGNNSLDEMIILAGTVMENAGQAATNVVLQGGTLTDKSSCTTHGIMVTKGSTATWQLSPNNYLAYANKITGEGTLIINPTNTSNRVRLTGDWSDFTGTIKYSNEDIWLPLDATTGLPKGTLDIASGCTVTNVAKTYTIGKLTGSGNLGYPISNFQNGKSVSGNNVWCVGNSGSGLGDFIFSGKIIDTGSTNKACFQKIGTCKMTVSGAWDNTGTVQVNDGELLTRSGSCLGKGALTVGAAGTLSGVGSLTNSSVTVNGMLSPGLVATIASGALDFGGKNVTVNTGGIIRVTASKSATNKVSASTNGCSTILNVGTMKMNGTVIVNVSASNKLAVGDSIRIWVAKSNSGTPKLSTYVIDEEKGLYWDDSRLNEGLLIVTNKNESCSINSIADYSPVKVQIISPNGIIIKSQIVKYNMVKDLLKATDIPSGVYVLRISDRKFTEIRKIRK